MYGLKDISLSMITPRSQTGDVSRIMVPPNSEYL